MARPPKQNADYFSHDNDMRNDEKIKAVRLRFKHEGYSIWNMLLEKLCKAKDFTLCYSDLNIEMWAGDFDIEPNRLKEIIEYFLKIELLFLHDGLIFSETMISRFSGLLSKRKRQSSSLSSAIIKNNKVIDDDNPQRKVKESKVNKIKEKESKEEEIKEESFPMIFYVGNEKISSVKKYLESNFQILMNDLKINYGEGIFNDSIHDFEKNNIQKNWNDQQDLRSHFTNYIRLRKEKSSVQKESKTSNHKEEIERLKKLNAEKYAGK